MVEWCYLGEQRFTEPFFETTIQYLIERPFRPDVSPSNAHQSWSSVPKAIREFHQLASSFTCRGCAAPLLVSQMLAASPANVVISEGLPLQSVLNAATLRPELTSRHAGWFRSLVHCWRSRRAGGSIASLSNSTPGKSWPFR